MASSIEVVLDYSASAEEVEAVRRLFELSVGEDADVRAQPPPPPGMGNGVNWMIWISVSVPLSTFLTSFGRKLGERMADQVADEGTGPLLRYFFGKFWEARRANPYPDGLVRIADNEDRAVLIHEWPNEAYESLLQTEWTQVEPGTYEWDPEAAEWVDSEQLIQQRRHVIYRRLKSHDDN